MVPSQVLVIVALVLMLCAPLLDNQIEAYARAIALLILAIYIAAKENTR